MTNYERIKSMSLDEMANLINAITFGESVDTSICHECESFHGKCIGEDKSCPIDTNKEWLMKENNLCPLDI